MKLAIIFLSSLLAIGFGILFALKLALGSDLEVDKKHLERFHGIVFSSSECTNNVTTDNEKEYEISIDEGHVKINSTVCEIGKVYSDGDNFGIGIKLKHCNSWQSFKNNRHVVFSITKENSTRVHMYGFGTHTHLCPINGK